MEIVMVMLKGSDSDCCGDSSERERLVISAI